VFSYLHRYPAAQLVATAHIIGVVVRCKLQPCYSGQPMEARGQTASGADGTNLWIAASGPAVSCRARSLSPLPPPSPFRRRLGWASGRCRSPNHATPRTHARARGQPSQVALRHSNAKKPRPALGAGWLPPALPHPQPSVSRRPFCGNVLRSSRPPRPSPPPSPLRGLLHSLSSTLPFYTTSPVRPKASPLSASATRPSWISESRSARSGLFSCLWWR